METTASIDMNHAAGVDPWHYRSLEPTAIYGIAHEAFELMHKYSMPPDPLSYAVWFAYVSNMNEPLVQWIDRQLQSHGKISNSEILEIYQMYIEGGYAQATSQNLALELEQNLKNVSSLVGRSVSNNRGFGESLKTTAAEIDQIETVEGLQSIVVQMLVENSEMSRVTEELSQELSESQAHITELNQKLEELQHLNLCDSLTAVSNRRAFDARLQNEVIKAEASKLSFCLILIDLDHFKRVNDNLGHQAGDEVLKRVARILDGNTPSEAMVARYGGEEFAVILPLTKVVDAHNLMIEILQKLRNERFFTEILHNEIGAITASFGITPHKPGRSALELVMHADKQLYAAKEAGRNRVKSEGLG